MSHSKLLNEFKEFFAINNAPLDFRSDVFAPNDYGGTPRVSYDRAKNIVVGLYGWAHTHIENNSENYPDFGCWVVNTEMEVDKLRSSTISNLVNRVIDELVIRSK